MRDFNRVIPASGPRLVYQKQSHLECDLKVTYTDTNIHICSGWPAGVKSYPGQATWWGRDGGQIFLNEAPNQNTACHEFMHILTHIRDNYRADKDSCVWGRESDPGTFDTKRITKKYR